LNYTDVERFKDLSLGEQCLELRDLLTTLDNLQRVKWWLEHSIAEQMNENEQTMVRHEDGITRLSYTADYDPNVLAELREIADPADLAGVYYPPEEKTVLSPEKWNMTKGRHLAALGKDYADIIDRARRVIKERPKLKYYEKDQRSTR